MFSFARARRGVRGAVCSFDNIVMPFIGPPWAKPASRFSAIFERLVIDWLKDATSEAVRKATALSWDEVEGIMQRAVNRGLAQRKPLDLRVIAPLRTPRSNARQYPASHQSLGHLGRLRGHDLAEASTLGRSPLRDARDDGHRQGGAWRQRWQPSAASNTQALTWPMSRPASSPVFFWYGPR